MIEEKFMPLSTLFKNIIRKKGIIGLYKGYIVTLNRDLIAYGIYFWFFFSSKDWLEKKGKYTHFNIMMTGGIAGNKIFIFIFIYFYVKGILNWCITYPFDTIKTIIQGDLSDKKLKQIDVAKILLRKSGIKAFFRGFNTTAIRAFFQNGLIFELNEICQNYFIKLDKDI